MSLKILFYLGKTYDTALKHCIVLRTSLCSYMLQTHSGKVIDWHYIQRTVVTNVTDLLRRVLPPGCVTG